MTQHNPSRRQVLQGAAAAALAAPIFIPASALGRDGNPAPSDRLNMGCIGVGGMGRGNMGRFLGFNDVRVVAVCDVDDNQAAQAAKTVNDRYGNEDCAVYKDFRELIARDDIDVVMIATPDHWHALTALAAVRAGKDVYCEKPITHTHEEGVALCEAVAKHKRIWQTGSQQRSTFNFRWG
ncbi:MAG: Gfo/Idh/MocA family oxidoreductase, partial [Phycisphaeraceae bacterium]